MDRRKFIKRAGAAGAASIIAPYILPSGRLFASTGSQISEHVILVLFGGGVRQQETILQRYLDHSQGLTGVEGNIMYNLFSGDIPDKKEVYGVKVPGLPDDQSIKYQQILNEPLDVQGTVFREVRCNQPSHYSGFLGPILGGVSPAQGLRQRPIMPTIFEYARKFGGFPASKVWMIGHGLENSIPLMNHSTHPDFGSGFGANLFIPGTTFGEYGIETFSRVKEYHPDEMMRIYQMQQFLDDYYRNLGKTLDNLGNTPEEKDKIRKFMKAKYDLGNATTEIDCAIEVMNEFEPNLMAVSFFEADGCHGNFTGYLRALHAMDHKVGRLWDAVQSNPNMKDNTTMILMPDMGRNIAPNAAKDNNDWLGFDHDGGDTNLQRIFAMMVGNGVERGLHIGDENNPVGEWIDACLTVAELLGIKSEVMNTGFVRTNHSLFDRI